MADNKIQGRAKKYDGTAIDYVSIFNWADGKCIAQVVPNTSGAWQYNYNKDVNVGITYVANGCEPVTHGAYQFTYEYNVLLDAILHYSFNGDVVDGSVNNLNGIKTGDAVFVEGRKLGTQAIKFTNGCVRTPSPIPINRNKVSLSFWVDFESLDLGIIMELSPVIDSNTGFHIATSVDRANTLQVTRNLSGYEVVVTNALNTSKWYHILITMDNSKADQDRTKIYMNSVDVSQILTASANAGNFINNILYIGQRGASSLPMRGKLQDLRVYNRVLNAAERTILFNE